MTNVVEKPVMETWFQEDDPVRFYPMGPTNPTWDQEIEKILPYTEGRGLDVGCGRRRLRPDNMVFFDKYEEAMPDVQGDPENIPFPDEHFDFVMSSHSLEHMENWGKVIDQMLRVTKHKGYICLIIPDTRTTFGLDKDHKHEWTLDSFIDALESYESFTDQVGIIDSGVAGYSAEGQPWSFYLVMQRGAKWKRRRGPVKRQVFANFQKIPKVCFFGDDPRITTGFAVVGKSLTERFHKNGFLVSYLGKYSPRNAVQPGEVPYALETTSKVDPNGVRDFGQWVNHERPDVIVMNADPGSVVQYLQTLNMFTQAKKVAYIPLEGIPTSPVVAQLPVSLDATIAYTQGAARYLEHKSGKIVKWAYHGVDHAPFKRFDDHYRKQVREAIGFGDKFVVGNVSRNKRTNDHPVYMEAIALLLSKGYTDILLYLHCQYFEGFMLDGWNLMEIRDEIGELYGVDLSKNILFPPDMNDQLAGVAYNKFTNYDFDDMSLNTPQQRGQLWMDYDLIHRYNCLDLYVDISEVQGFCIPNFEAAACGVPLLTVDDRAVRKELWDEASYKLIQPDATSWWHNGGPLMHVNPQHLADEILAAYQDHKGLAQASQRGLDHAAKFKWDDAAATIMEELRQLL